MLHHLTTIYIVHHGESYSNAGYFVLETDGTYFTVIETYGIHKAGREKAHEE